MTVDQEIRKEQKEYMSRMTKKEKLFYLASYYKWYVIGIIVLIVFSIIIISDVIKGMRPTYLYAVLSNTYLMNDISDEGIEEDFIRYTGLDTDKYQLSFDMSLSF
ncbi:MAG: hypothetical protein K5931_11610, partial [Lachnospiraceae bacterium]|nr:hypothetical protein [Lachnospiraceae bacterium]